MGAHNTWDVTNMDPKGMVGGIVGDHFILLYTKYVSSGPHGFRYCFLGFFSYIVLYEQMTPWGMASLRLRLAMPQGVICSYRTI